MLLPDELVALAEWRREAIEEEIRLHQLLSQAPRQPARWRQWSGGGLMWAGAMLVQWGEGMTASNSQPNRHRSVELLN